MRPGIKPHRRPRPNRKARRRYVQWSPGRIEYMKNLTALQKMMQEDKKRNDAWCNTWAKKFRALDKKKKSFPWLTALPPDYPPNDWMCGIRGPYAAAPPLDDMGFGPLFEMRKEAREAPLFPLIRHHGLQIIHAPDLLRSQVGLGLGMLDVFMIQDPTVNRQSLMQIKLLEEEARRHFPQMDAAGRAAYVLNSIEQANKPPENETPPTE